MRDELEKRIESSIKRYHEDVCEQIVYDQTRYYEGVEVGVRNALAMLDLKPEWMKKPNR